MRRAFRFLGLLLVAATFMFVTNGHGQQAPHYVLDGFGGVHAGGGAPAISGIPYFGWDIARDIAYVPGPTTDGVLVLDGFGGVHATGLGVVLPATPYFGFDVARGITYRNIPSRMAARAQPRTNTDITTSTWTDIESVTIDVPNDGNVLVMCNISLFCSGCTNVDPAGALVGIGLDTLTPAGDVWRQIRYYSGDAHSETWTQTVPVAAGTHTIACIAMSEGYTQHLTYFNPTISALFIDHGATGVSRPDNAGPHAPGGSGR